MSSIIIKNKDGKLFTEIQVLEYAVSHTSGNAIMHTDIPNTEWLIAKLTSAVNTFKDFAEHKEDMENSS